MKRHVSEADCQKLIAEIERLSTLNNDELKARWQAVYGTAAPARMKRDLLRYAVAYRLQESAFGGPNPSTRRLLERVADDTHARRPVKVAPVRKLPAGTVLVRTWGGIDHQVMLQGLWIAAMALLLTAVFAPISSHWVPRRDLADWVISISRLWLVASFLAFLAVTLVELIEWLSRSAMFAVPSRASFDPARRAFFGYAAYLAGGIPFLATAWGFGGERLRYHVERVEVPIADLPKSLDGLRIVQLSDIHIGAFMPQTEVRRAVEMANQLNPDLAVLTGDLISFDGDPLEACIAELSRLRAPLGIWGCNGNHELYAEVEGASQDLFERYGMGLLRQRNTELRWNGGKLNLIGVDYQRGSAPSSERSSMLQSIESLVRKDIPNILLSHNPNTFPRAAALGIELSLAGHTHGGQIRVEIVNRGWNPARFFTKFVAGLYHLPLGDGAPVTADKAAQLSQRTACLYVNRGLGTFVMPVRLGVPPEITLLTLRASG